MSHNNNFNLLRLIFAVAVVYAHSFALLGLDVPHFFGRGIGNIAVHGFFVISGYLITDSFMRNPSVLVFSWNRALRIAPGLVIAILFSGYVAKLCGGYEANPVKNIVNGPLWTLTWEVVCYIGVALLGVMGVLNRAAMPTFFAVSWIVYLSNLGNLSSFYAVIVPMLMMFVSGIFLQVAKGSIALKKAVFPALLVLVFCFNSSLAEAVVGFVKDDFVFLWGASLTTEEVVRVAYLAAFPIVVVYVCIELKYFLSAREDISYGVYVYGWPIAQAIVYFCIVNGFSLTPAWLFVIGMLATAPIAWASWRFIERPALNLKRRTLRKAEPASAPQ